MINLEFRMLGPLEVWRGEEPVLLPPGRPRALLGLLLVQANTVVTTDRLLEELWRGDPPRTAGHALQVYVANLRKLLEPGREAAGSAVVMTRRPGYVLVVPPERCDARCFERLAADGGRALDEGRPGEATRIFADALALWRGPVLADLMDEPFVRAEATRLGELRLVATERRVEAELDLGRHAEVTGELEALVQRHPLRERLWSQLMVALYRSSRQADALSAYQRVRTILADELGLEPGPELRRLEAAVLRHDPQLTLPAASRDGDRGSRPFEPDVPAAVPLPARLAMRPTVGFFGREVELRRLTDPFKAGLAGEGRRVVLVQGEPGVGKTTLAAEFARRIHGEGAVVLYGRCEEGLALPYQPFAEALSHYVNHVDEGVLAAQAGHRASELTVLVPALARRLPGIPPSRSTEADTQRYLLFSAVVGLLAAVSASRPVLIVLDDLHWADQGTLLLLRYLVGADVAMRLLVLGTYRGSDLGDAPALGETLAALWRHHGVERLDLGGLNDADVVALMKTGAGHDLGEVFTTLAHHLRRETGGNPFFLLEIMRHLTEQGLLSQENGRWAAGAKLAELGTPQSLREVVGQRVARLGEPAGDLLRHGAVIGRDFDVELLSEATDAAEPVVVDALEQATAAALLTAVGPGRYSFAHAVIQYTLYDGLSPTRRLLAHRRVAEALERLHGARPGPRVGELARHWVAAAGSGATTTAMRYARSAGDSALSDLAFEDAVSWFSQGLELQNRQSEIDRHEQVDLLIGLGSAQRLTGDPGHRETLLDAAHLAQEIGDTGRLVRAALANSRGVYSSLGIEDSERIEVVKAALAATSGDTPERARLLAILCCELIFTDDWPTRQALAAQARDMARRLSDRETLLRVLHTTYDATTVPETLEERRTMTAEALGLAADVADPAIRHGIYRYHLSASADAGDLESVDRDLSLLTAAAAETGDPWLQTYPAFFQAWRSLLAGNVQASEAWAAEFLDLGLRGGFGEEARFYHAWMLLDIRRHQDRVIEQEAYFTKAARELERLPFVRAVLALLYCDAGKTAEAEELLAEAAAEGFADLRYDPMWLYGMVSYADVSARLHQVEAATQLYERLAPFHAQLAFAWWATGGAVAFYLGMLATILGRFDDAQSHFAEALAIHERLRAPYWIARTHLETARMLVARQSPGNAEEAAALLDQVAATATQFGFPILQRVVREGT